MNSGARAPRAGGDGRADVLLVCSAGGHVLQLFMLRSAWAGLVVHWVTHDKDDTRSLLAAERVEFAHGPTTRNVVNLLRNLRLAWRVIRRVRPMAVVTTGAGVAVPFAWVGRALGVRVVFIESLTRLERPSLTCRLVRPVATRTYVQWPELGAAVPNAVYAGSVLD